MNAVIIATRRRALAYPGWKDGPAPFASMVLTIVQLGRHSVAIIGPRPANDNGRIHVRA